MVEVLASFLGTSNYREATYLLYDEKVRTKYIQSALLQILNTKNWKKKEREKIFRIFLTPTAKEKNWSSLKSEIEKLPIDIKLEPIFIDKDIISSETQIWQLFEKLASSFNENESVTFDITHGFRFYPMMLMVMLSYLKLTKNIKVAGIFYGAWEARQKIDDEEVTPILELTDLDKIFDWIIGTQNFVKYGISETLTELLENESRNILKETQGKDKNAEQLKKFSVNLKIFTKSIRTCRGKEIISGFSKNKFSCEDKAQLKEPEKLNYEILKNLTDEFEIKNGKYSKLLKNLLKEIQISVKNFSTGRIENLLSAAKWCYSHDLIQQGYTFLREYITTCIVKKEFGIEKIFCFKQREEADKKIILSEEWENLLLDIAKYRNDINHCGMREETHSTKVLKEQLGRLIKKVQTEKMDK
ncbi:TIGR02221 family CRISPR-associated protein [Desulfurobacterium indicum]|uniref:CRISPR-associated protein n=1 Tax=Desulfurobacterium indicum TaxID=1914305 RepID=A0A1R1ML22_9BACT|nr:TIGR02221 family CRISPR-associated protein [Desulfurobacterium indicum]OMH40394.1 CRISPR-associated protein [Desulfurobacterium indicum]